MAACGMRAALGIGTKNELNIATLAVNTTCTRLTLFDMLDRDRAYCLSELAPNDCQKGRVSINRKQGHVREWEGGADGRERE